MRMAVIVVLLMSVVMSSDSRAAGEQQLGSAPAPGVNGGRLFPQPVTPSTDVLRPFTNLFDTPLQPDSKSRQMVMFQALQNLRSASNTKPTVLCGMTLVPVDPNLDAAIRHTVPRDGVRWTVRAVPPPACER